MQKNINKLETQSEENQDANLQPKNNENSPVEIAIEQFNKLNPVAYVTPQKCNYGMVNDENCYAQRINGHTVRIEVELPHDKDSMMIVQTRKTKLF